MSSPKPRKIERGRWFRPSFWFLLLFVAGCCFFVKIGYDFWSGAIERVHRHDCSNNLKRIGYALHEYHDRYRSLPPVSIRDELGTPRHSWRTLVLPFLGHESIHAGYDFTEPWDGVNNRRLSRESPGFVDRMRPGVFHCWKDTDSDYENTSYLVVSGEGTPWPHGAPVKLSDIASPRETVLVVEVSKSDVRWSEPRDLSVAEMLQRIGGNHEGVVPVLMADGSVLSFTPEQIQTDAFGKLFHITEAQGQLEQFGRY